MTLETIRFWVAIVLLVDGSIGLLGESALQKAAPGIRIRIVALVEIFGALALLVLHFLLRANP